MITERAMLAAIHISVWTAIKHDRKVSREVAEQHGAYAGAGRYNKQLLREAERLESLRALSGQIRQYFYRITLPWSDEGYRLLPAHLYFELTTKMREFEQAFAQQVEEFLAVYPSYIEQVRPELNGLFREEDYPSTDKLRNKFGVKLEVLPIPSGNENEQGEVIGLHGIFDLAVFLAQETCNHAFALGVELFRGVMRPLRKPTRSIGDPFHP